MKFSFEKYDTTFVSDYPEHIAEARRDHIAKMLSERLSNLSTDYAYEYWKTGCVRDDGYVFFPDESPIRVLVSRINDDGENVWVERVAPSRDKEVIRKYIRKFEGEDCAWIFLNEKDITVM